MDPASRAWNARLAFALLGALLSATAARTRAADDGVVIAGDACFTVITPHSIRLEYAKGGGFTDAPSLFAVNRAARFAGAKVTREGNATAIDTGAIRLSYTPDGNPFSAQNLKATIRKGTGAVEWSPGLKNDGNLGGTIRTLDGARGPRDLGQALLSRDGWFLLDDSRGNLFTADWVRARPKDAGTDWYLFGYGLDYRAAFQALAAVGGPVPLPRKYALGAWYSRYWPYSSKDYRQIVQEYADHDFPLDVMVMDMDWHRKGWTGWSWNRELLLDAEELLKWFHQQGLFVTLNVHPADGVGPQEDGYAAFMQAMGQDRKAPKGLLYDAGDKKYLDTLFKYTHVPLEAAGVDFWWLDWQQYPNTRSIPELTNLAWLNHYYYQHTGRDGKRGLSFSRWPGWGDHRHPIHFSGDANTGWPMLAFEVPFTATAGNVGCFFWSHDIGGHMGGRNEESYARWCQFGALTAALRSHSTRAADMDRRPWTYPKWAEDSMRISFHLRSELFPYIYASVAQSCRETVPLTRPLYVEYPELEPAYHNGQEYLFGDLLLVAPIATPGVGAQRLSRQVVWFPKGTWYNYFTGEWYDGEAEALVAADLNEFPLYVRGGVPLPMQPYAKRMATAPLNELVVRCYPSEEGQVGRFTLYEDDGLTTAYTGGASATTELACTRRGGTLTVTLGPAKGRYDGQVRHRAYRLEFPCTVKAQSASVDGQPAPVEYDEETWTNRVRVPARSVEEAVTVAIQTGAVSASVPRDAGLRRRAEGLLSQKADAKSVKELLAAAAPKLDAALREALLATAGIGLVKKNEAPYFFGGPERVYFYAPLGSLDLGTVGLAVTEQVGAETRLLGRSNPPVTGQPIAAPEPPPATAPVAAAARRVARAEFRIGGQAFTLEVVLQEPKAAGKAGAKK